MDNYVGTDTKEAAESTRKAFKHRKKKKKKEMSLLETLKKIKRDRNMLYGYDSTKDKDS